jgi:chromosome segregation ATPase
MAPSGNMGKRKMIGNNSPPKNKLVQDSKGNEENRYPDPDFNKTKKTMPKNPKYILKEEILQVVTDNIMEMLLDMVDQNTQKALKKFQEDKNKEYEKTEKQINEIIRALNKNQNETKNTINREINKLRTKIDSIKEEVTHDMENLRKNNETEVQNKTEGHSSRIKKTEDRISELKDEKAIKGKIKDLLVKQLKTCERNMQELTDYIKRPKPENHGHGRRRIGASKRNA